MPLLNTHVIFSTSAKKNFTWIDGLEDVTNEDITELIFHCEWSIAALVAECSKRKRASTEPEESLNHFKVIEENAEAVHKDDGLNKKQKSLWDKNRPYLIQLHCNRPVQGERYSHRICRQLCLQIQRWTNWTLTILLLISFGRENIYKIHISQAVQLAQLINAHQESLSQKVYKALNTVINLSGLQPGERTF